LRIIGDLVANSLDQIEKHRFKQNQTSKKKKEKSQKLSPQNA